MEWKELFKKTRRPETAPARTSRGGAHPEVPEGLMKKCNACKSAILTEDVRTTIISAPSATTISGYTPTGGWK